VYIAEKHAVTFTVKANAADTIAIDDEYGHLITIESVVCTTAGTYNNGEGRLEAGAKIAAIKVGEGTNEKTYIITRAYMVADILIEAYGKTLTIVTM
jgi:hypothetical protein